MFQVKQRKILTCVCQQGSRILWNLLQRSLDLLNKKKNIRNSIDWLLRSFIGGCLKHLQHLFQTVNVAKKSSRGEKLQLLALKRFKTETEDDVELNGHEISREKHFGELQTEKENALYVYTYIFFKVFMFWSRNNKTDPPLIFVL